MDSVNALNGALQVYASGVPVRSRLASLMRFPYRWLCLPVAGSSHSSKYRGSGFSRNYG